MTQTLKKVFTAEELDGEPEVATARIATILYRETAHLPDEAMCAIPATIVHMLCIGYLALYSELDLDEDSDELLH